MGDWTFFSNYGHVLVCLANNREARLRDVALEVGITERAVQKIVRDLQDSGFLTVSKQGRCNRYRINRRKALRHALQSHCTVGKVLTLLAKPAGTEWRAREHAELAEPVPPVIPQPDREDVVEEAVEEPVEEPAVESQEKEEPKETAAVDIRQQGSLF